MVRVKRPTNALGDLVDQVCEANGWSRRELSKRIQERGYDLSNSRVNQLCTDIPLLGIQSEPIFALAAGLSTSPVRVAVAALDAMGVSIADTALTPAEAIAHDPGLSADTKSALLSILSNAERRGTA